MNRYRATAKESTATPVRKSKPSKLGLELRRLAEEYAKSGNKPLTLRQIRKEVAERRAG